MTNYAITFINPKHVYQTWALQEAISHEQAVELYIKDSVERYGTHISSYYGRTALVHPAHLHTGFKHFAISAPTPQPVVTLTEQSLI